MGIRNVVEIDGKRCLAVTEGETPVNASATGSSLKTSARRPERKCPDGSMVPAGDGLSCSAASSTRHPRSAVPANAANSNAGATASACIQRLTPARCLP